MPHLTLRPAVRYTYNGETVIDICGTPAGLAEHLEHLHANGYADAHPVTVTEDGTVRVVDTSPPEPLDDGRGAVHTCPNCGGPARSYLHTECEAEYLAYVTGQTIPG